ncbi:MAG TPA: ATP-binding protein [Steroidobacteraceae bacterium]|jgi:two-component system chemotaxis sensor kinase CheA|nr:ATP-binding protein [Steroidobacteraceae bacterium]
MNRRLASSLVPHLTGGGLVVLVVILAFAFVAVVLIPGVELASELADTTVALKFVGQQQRNPALIHASLDSMHDHLTTRGYIQESLDQLREAATKLDAGLHEMNAPRSASWFALSGDTSAKGEPIAGKHAAALRELWSKEQESLEPILKFQGVPYQDNESTGTALNENGKQMERDVAASIRVSKRVIPLIDGELNAIVSDLQTGNARSATELRFVMLTGLLIAIVLAALVSILLLARQRQDASLRQARQQTADILRTVKDGLFLLDENLIIGASYSSALESLFQRSDFAGLSFEKLLKDIVSEKTLSTAVKFVGVLWSERTKENLVKTINPLGEIEVNFDTGQGKMSTRYLQFDFHRVRVDGKITQVLVAVADVSARVDLARELQSSQTQAQAQVDTLLGILHVDPAQLASFLNDSNAAMKMINAVLREPAREENAFRKKLDTLFRQVHSVKGEAAALGLSSIESRAHSFEDDLKNLREKSDLSGNDFLPLVIKLDDLLTHLQSVGDLVSRLARLHGAAATRSETDSHTDTAILEHGGSEIVAKSDGSMPSMLQQLTARVANENNKEAALQCMGFDTVPDEYRRIVKDIAVQAVRNSIVHGLESASDRLGAGKPTQGQLKLIFQELGDAGYKLIAEDDGQGLSTDKIKQAALKKGFITPEKAATLDAKQVFSLLFQPGFSTVENATKDAGRGVGMNLMAGLMQQIGGKVSVATVPGKFTRITLSLPPAKRAGKTEAA